MKSWRLYFYHGMLPENLRKELREYCDWSESDDGYDYIFNGTLDGFAEKWKRNFIVYKEGTLGITQHKSFGQR